MVFQLVPKSVTLNDLKGRRPNDHRRARSLRYSWASYFILTHTCTLSFNAC